MSVMSRLTAEGRYRDYLRRLDARALLEHYGVQNDHDETTHSGETEVIHSCLLDRVDRHHNNGDQNPSAACNLERKLYVCYSYWGGDLFHLVQKLENRGSFEAIIPVIAPFLAGTVTEPDAFLEELEGMLADGAYSANLPSYSERVLSPWAFVHPYLHERGIDSDTANRLRIGWRHDENRITIPHFWDGKLVGWQSRAVPDRPGLWPGTAEPMPKYRSTPGFPKSDTLYHDHSRPFPRSGTVVVVESPFSVVKATSLRLDVPVVATFGAKVSATQTSILSDFDEVILWPDPDQAGRIMERTVARRLQRHPGLRVVEPDPGRDMADCQTLDEVKGKIESAVPAVLRDI
jgi:hypothetical protein